MNQFNAFCRVVEAEGFSAAAAKLNVVHTVMSRQIRQLETMLGTRLLNRTTCKLALKGRTFSDFASGIYRTPGWK